MFLNYGMIKLREKKIVNQIKINDGFNAIYVYIMSKKNTSTFWIIYVHSSKFKSKNVESKQIHRFTQ